MDEEFLDRTDSLVAKAFARSPGLLAGTYWDAKKRVLVVKVLDSADQDAVRQAQDAVEAALATQPHVPVEYRSSATSDLRGQEVAEELLRTMTAEPATRKIAATYYDASTGHIVILSGDLTVAEVRDAVASLDVDGFPVDVRVDSIVLQAGNRRQDAGGWTAGNWMFYDTRPASGPADCTQGFAWRKWGSGTVYGGLAYHCASGGSHASWFQGTRSIGTLTFANQSVDGGLLAAAPGTSFNADAWVGGVTTTDVRTVTGVASSYPVNAQVALSAANSGLNTAAVVGPVNISGLQPGSTILTTGYFSVPGDSGGPWLKTYSNGTVQAWGQHLGVLRLTGQAVFQTVLSLSAGLDASIYTP